MAKVKHYVFEGVSGREQIANARYYSKMLGSEHEIHYHRVDEPCPGFLVGPRFTRRCFVIGNACEPPQM